MLEKKLDQAKNKRKSMFIKLIFSIIVAMIGTITFIVLIVLDCLSLSPSISDTVLLSVVFWTIYCLSFVAMIIFIPRCFAIISHLSNIENEIDDILFRQSLPTKYCYDVELKTNSVVDIHFNYCIQGLCIRYRENFDDIEYKYKLGKKKYHEFVTIDVAKSLFECEFLKQY